MGVPQPPERPGLPTDPLSGLPQPSGPAGLPASGAPPTGPASGPPGGIAGQGPVSGQPFSGQQGPFTPPPFPQPPFPPPRPSRRAISRSKLLLIILIVCGALIVTGGGLAFIVYDRATEIDRSTPTVAVVQFVRATFSDRNDDRVKLFTCPQWTSERTSQVQGRFDPEVKVSLENAAVQSQQAHQAVVTARMRLVFQSFVDFQDWRFDVVEENGWRVCGAGPA